MPRNKKINQDRIPDMIMEILPVWQKEIDRLQALEEPSKDDINLSLKLVAALTTTYTTYRILRNELKKEIGSFPLDRAAAYYNNVKEN